MSRPLFALLTVALVWLAHAYAAVTPIADLGVARLPSTTGIAALIVLTTLVLLVRRAIRDMPPPRRPLTPRIREAT